MDNKKCKKWYGQLRELRGKHAEFRQAYADGLKFAEENPGVRETAFGGCRVLFNEIKGLVLALREDFPWVTKEQIELIDFLEKDYAKMRGTLEHYEISTDGMPTWELVKKGLTREVLTKALKLAKPTLLLVAPNSRESKVEAVNSHRVIGQIDTYTYEINDDDLWNEGKPQAEKWRVSIVEGIQNVAKDVKIYGGRRTNYEMCKLWVKKYEDQGLDVINDADTYLTLMMKSLGEGKPMDTDTCTVLNGKNLEKTSLMAYGDWDDDQVSLDYEISDDMSVFRLRGLVVVTCGVRQHDFVSCRLFCFTRPLTCYGFLIQMCCKLAVWDAC
jgi:ribosomal protein L30E